MIQVKKTRVNSKLSAANGSEETILGTHRENQAVTSLGVVPRSESMIINSLRVLAYWQFKIIFFAFISVPKEAEEVDLLHLLNQKLSQKRNRSLPLEEQLPIEDGDEEVVLAKLIQKMNLSGPVSVLKRSRFVPKK